MEALSGRSLVFFLETNSTIFLESHWLCCCPNSTNNNSWSTKPKVTYCFLQNFSYVESSVHLPVGWQVPRFKCCCSYGWNSQQRDKPLRLEDDSSQDFLWPMFWLQIRIGRIFIKANKMQYFKCIVSNLNFITLLDIFFLTSQSMRH